MFDEIFAKKSWGDFHTTMSTLHLHFYAKIYVKSTDYIRFTYLRRLFQKLNLKFPIQLSQKLRAFNVDPLQADFTKYFNEEQRDLK